MDGEMFNNEFFKFDVDDEVDAIRKAHAFVAHVCKPLKFPLVVKQQKNFEMFTGF
jgi:hypothetical protein